MKVGIDIDGVIFETDKSTKICSRIFDLFFLKLIPHKTKEEVTENRYNWIKKHFGKLEKKLLKPLTKIQSINNGARTMISLLKKDKNIIYVVSARGTSILNGGEELTEVAEKKLKEERLIFDKYLWGHLNKARICKEMGIDVMLEDSYTTCKNLAKHGIHSIYFVNILPKNSSTNNYIHPVTNCIDAFFEISNIKKSNSKSIEESTDNEEFER